jgi:hypothetical protein
MKALWKEKEKFSKIFTTLKNPKPVPHLVWYNLPWKRAESV